MAARRPFWKWHRWKSIGFCLWPPSTCIWNLKLKFQSKLDLRSGYHVVYRQTDGRTDRRTDGRTRWIQYTPLQLRWAYMRHTFWSCLIRCVNMKWIQQVLFKIQSRHNSVHRLTDGQDETSIPPSTLLSRGYNKILNNKSQEYIEDID